MKHPPNTRFDWSRDGEASEAGLAVGDEDVEVEGVVLGDHGALRLPEPTFAG